MCAVCCVLAGRGSPAVEHCRVGGRPPRPTGAGHASETPSLAGRLSSAPPSLCSRVGVWRRPEVCWLEMADAERRVYECVRNALRDGPGPVLQCSALRTGRWDTGLQADLTVWDQVDGARLQDVAEAPRPPFWEPPLSACLPCPLRLGGRPSSHRAEGDGNAPLPSLGRSSVRAEGGRARALATSCVCCLPVQFLRQRQEQARLPVDTSAEDRPALNEGARWGHSFSRGADCLLLAWKGAGGGWLFLPVPLRGAGPGDLKRREWDFLRVKHLNTTVARLCAPHPFGLGRFGTPVGTAGLKARLLELFWP